MIYALICLFVLCMVAALFINMHPVFGGKPSSDPKEYTKFDNYVNGKFVNRVATKMDMSVLDYFSMSKDSISGSKDRKPGSRVPVSKLDWNKIKSEEDSLTWFGHSAFLLSIDNKKILVDPMLGPVASPVSFVGSKRYSEDMLRVIDEMPPIDAVFITHDHYDHLDYPSIRKLKGKVSHFFVPYGVSAHLVRWGVAKENITELNWWDETEFRGLTVALTPSKHFSGRGLFNRDRSLWGGWVILGKQTRFYTSGDGGYDGHFKEIGEKYGPFDIALMEGGQYDRRWSWVHMTPEEAVQAYADVKGKNMMLIHWGAFTLAFHGWTEPIERALAEAKKANVNLLAPQIGETIALNEELLTNANSPWWR
ncbi:L-ascorbate metabolism protein UlaG, beta-lactamase superfamily [Paenibacillus sp. UNCCL117]|uniref:MBL fold metallo-hydrolase n=1 Tax=unclassified Paenibacillus TaxID=185978 RepID=UPI0008852D33|nr:MULTISPECIES: MBL fold metallo-hydrolase [unclassified Paenibacillus]SDD68190.1 L-ascorbate metabolism protein UlaG, beta-lactamase superfamily [Paenibacillus sp. cl123]SFW70998.1 L-ascorbate metabolism protein UlaG, beta-lactamase superfamily [Paenibacillus sp. UNCCL117]